MSQLEVKDLSISFGGVKAVRDVSFRVEKGAVYSIIGPNGAGKSTVFNLVTRVITPDAGQVRFEGEDLLTIAPSRIARQGVARTFQNLELFPDASVADNILVGRHIHFSTSPVAELLGLGSVRRQEAENREKVDEILSLLGLESHRNTPVGSLPYGICKIVELARALACEPRLLLLDEPAAGLNTAETDRMASWIEEVNHRLGITIVLIEHDMRLVSRVSHRVLALNAGRVLTEGTALEVQTHPDVIKAYLGG
ncbi:ABC transporter ATP-binding protein [Rhodoligotrophos ferricapiens]|uniref:ABC transporter ATP-binding protein n=1 Tax=Rhodoligotrophos ferricapiens TaxID=3069264 RepID=UPI00315D1EF8